jgi:uncharacterized membrane protein
LSAIKNQKKPRGGLSRAFLTGLATLLPTVLTILILTIAYNFLDEKIAGPLNNLIQKGLSSQIAKEHFWGGILNYPDWQLDEEIDSSGAPERADDLPFSQFVEGIAPQWLGFLLALLLVFTVGIVFRGYLGRQLLKLIESFIRQIPLIKIIYPYAKQVTEFFFEEKNQIEYETAVAVEYPRKGIWSLGFVTSSGFKAVSDFADEEMVSIFIPSSPTPITGYTILASRDSIIQLDLSVEEVLRFTISGGVILPPSQLPDKPNTTAQVDSSVETSSEEEDEGVGKP